jgi:intron-binding protein aquarius
MFLMSQKAAFAKFPDLRDFSLANVASVDTREALLKHFGPLRYECGVIR